MDDHATASSDSDARPISDTPKWIGPATEIPDPKARLWPIDRDTLIAYMGRVICENCARPASEHAAGTCLFDHTHLKLPEDLEHHIVPFYRDDCESQMLRDRQEDPEWRDEWGDGPDGGDNDLLPEDYRGEDEGRCAPSEPFDPSVLERPRVPARRSFKDLMFDD